MAKRLPPEVQAGSMADIAFLLLIFFLVTTTVDKDKGILRQLPSTSSEPPEGNIKQKNILRFLVNQDNELLANDDRITIADVREKTIAFLDNGGLDKTNEHYCDYCQGERLQNASDNPNKAVVAIEVDRLSNYKTYIALQNEVLAAYNFLRNREANRLFSTDYLTIKKQLDEAATPEIEQKLKEQLTTIRNLYPQQISEAKTQ